MTHTAHSIAYYQELVATQAHIINYERDRRKQLEDTIANRNLPVNMRQATLAIKKLVDTSSPDENGWYRAHLPRLADSGGSSASTMSRALRNFAECTGAIELHKVPDTHDPYKEILYIKPTDLLDRPADIIPLKDIKRHGGDHRVFCDACGSEDLIERKKQVCRSCGNVVKEFADRAVNTPLQDATGERGEEQSVPGTDGTANEEETHALDPLHLATSTLPITTQHDCISVEHWLLQRRGHGPLIWQTGSLVNTQAYPKYLTKPSEYIPDIAAYLRGDLTHIYGSRPALPDGTTSLLGFDIEDPELDKSHTYMMFRLALAGIASVYWKRRPGRGHLEVYTDTPVDRKAFYAHVVRVSPDLAKVPEVFPIGSDQNTNGDDRSDYGYSWPLYYRSENQVIECAAEFMFPDRPGELVVSSGYTSDRAGLVHLLSRAILPSESIPARPTTAEVPQRERTQPDVLLLEKPRDRSSREATDLWPLVHAEWDKTHSWEEVIALCGGIQKNKHFFAVWREERTASVKVDADGQYACDYGSKRGAYPKKLDTFGVYCLAKKLDQAQEIHRLCTEYRVWGENVPENPSRETICTVGYGEPTSSTQPASAQEHTTNLVQGMRVNTPAGIGVVSVVRYFGGGLCCWRCSVWLDGAPANGSRYAIFDAAQVQSLEQVRFL